MVDKPINTIFRTCDKCGNRFEVRENIAVDMDAWAAQGEPYVQCDCLPNDSYAEDALTEYEKSGELEDALDAQAERFPNGDDPMMWCIIETKCRKCNVDLEIQAGEVAWCPSCHEQHYYKR